MTQALSGYVLRTMTVIGALALQDAGAVASPIYACPVAADLVQDMRVYTFDGHSMTALTSTAALETAQRTRTTLYFVVKPAVGDRKGAIVIKTARLGPAFNDDRPPPDRVHLRREAAASTC